jgi:hypothetical protein
VVIVRHKLKFNTPQYFFIGEEIPKIGASGPKNGDECPCNWSDTLMEPSSPVFQISNSDVGP